jgi:hypothetical protein
MTTVERQFNTLARQIRELKARVDNLVPLDTEGEYKKAFTTSLGGARKLKNRFLFKNGLFTPAK